MGDRKHRGDQQRPGAFRPVRTLFRPDRRGRSVLGRRHVPQRSGGAHRVERTGRQTLRGTPATHPQRHLGFAASRRNPDIQHLYVQRRRKRRKHRLAVRRIRLRTGRNRRRSFMGRRKRRNGRDQYVPVLSAPGEGRRLFRSRNPQKRRTAAGTYAEAAQSDLFGAQSPRNRHPVAMGGPTRIHALREGQRHRLRLLPGSVRSRPADFRESDGHPFGHSRRTALRREIQTRTCVGPVPRRIARNGSAGRVRPAADSRLPA